jgi:transposase
VLHEVTGSETVPLGVLFPQLAGLEVLRVEDLGAAGHDRYPRWLRDLPCGGRAVEVLVSVRRFRCANPACPAATFAEQVPGLTAWYQRRTAGLRALLEAAALALAGRAGARLAAALGAAVSRHTLLRLVRAMPDPEAGQAAVLGVDDVAVRKGQRYATVLVDMDTHQVIDLLPGRAGDALADWLKARPGTGVICRDRAGAYADGAARGAPDAVQVADRWHLWHNLCEHARKTAARHRGCLRGDPPPAAPAGGEPPGGGQGRAGGAGGRPPRGQVLEARTRERHQLVSALRAQGKGIRAIMRETGLAKQTVRRYYRAASAGDLTAPAGPSVLDPYKPYLDQRRTQGNASARRLHEEIRALGYQGSQSTVGHYLQRSREPRPARPAAPAPPAAGDIARWILTSPGALDDDDKTALARARQRCPHLDALAGHVTEFAKILTGRHGDRLDDWLKAVEADDQPDLHSFANGIRRDHDAVRNGLTLPYSSGAVEGNNCKIKHIKRIMYGRANLDLLRKMILLN